MIIVQLLGGLGNQLFQYAAGRALAERHGTDLALDISEFKEHNLRTYRLGYFNIHARIAEESEINRITGRTATGLRKWLFNRIQQRRPYYGRQIVQERHFHYDLNIRLVCGRTYLKGYWQSEKYFGDIASIIREEITIKHAPEGLNRSLLEQIEAGNSVSLHVRRSDYVTDPKTNSHHGVCSPAFYEQAIQLVAQRVQNPNFFVFSDDMDWVKEHLPIAYPTTYIEHNGSAHDYEDLRLMSHCKHHIIANSSFSWWGAWLAAHPSQIVVAPERWFSVDTHDTKDLLPHGWLKLPM